MYKIMHLDSGKVLGDADWLEEVLEIAKRRGLRNDNIKSGFRNSSADFACFDCFERKASRQEQR